MSQETGTDPSRPGAPRRLRVARVYFHLETGGIERRLVDLLPRLDRRRFDVRMLCLRRLGEMAPELERRGIPVECCRVRSKMTWLSIPRLARWFRRAGIDIVHGHAEFPSRCATRAARRAGVPVMIANIHTVDQFADPRVARRERKRCPHDDATVHVSENVYRSYLENVRPEKDRGVVIHNGVDLAHFAARPASEKLRDLERELGIDGCTPRLLNVARMHVDKRHGDVLDAFAMVRERHPRAVLLLAGGGRRQAVVEQSVRERGLEESVRLLGIRTDMAELYHLADVGILASLREGFANVVLEAMAAGVPQVLTDIASNREALGDSEAALLVPARRPQALGQALLRVLEDPALSPAMRDAARNRVRRFTVEEQVRKTEQLYLDLARQKGLV